MKCLKKLTASVLLSSLLLSNFCFALNPNSTYYREVINVPHGKIVKIQEENIDKSVSYYHYPTQEIFTFSDKNFVNELDNFVIENNLVEVSTSTEEYERVRDFFETEYPKQIKDYKFELNRYFVSPNLENQTKNSYDLITNATTTVLIEDSFIPLTSTTSTTTNPYQSATTLIATTTPTQTYQPPAVLAINNPYGYPYTYVNNIPVFILPNGTTSTDPLTRIYNTIAKNLNNLTIASTSASSSITYTKFYPTQNYEYDTRGVITINIPFNGKTVGTYKYDTTLNSTIPPEISFATLNHLGTPVILTDTSSNLTQKIKRDEWGSINQNVYDTQAVTNTNLGFTNQKQDIDSNLTYIHQRYLSTQNKVWLSNDPMSIENFSSLAFLMDPQNQNSYSYVKNDPMNKFDPDGKNFKDFISGKQDWKDYRAENKQYIENEIDKGSFVGNAFKYSGITGTVAGGAVFGCAMAPVVCVKVAQMGALGGTANMGGEYLDSKTNPESTPDYVNSFTEGSIIGGTTAFLGPVQAALYSGVTVYGYRTVSNKKKQTQLEIIRDSALTTASTLFGNAITKPLTQAGKIITPQTATEIYRGVNSTFTYYMGTVIINKVENKLNSKN